MQSLRVSAYLRYGVLSEIEISTGMWCFRHAYVPEQTQVYDIMVFLFGARTSMILRPLSQQAAPSRFFFVGAAYVAQGFIKEMSWAPEHESYNPGSGGGNSEGRLGGKPTHFGPLCRIYRHLKSRLTSWCKTPVIWIGMTREHPIGNTPPAQHPLGTTPRWRSCSGARTQL